MDSILAVDISVVRLICNSRSFLTVFGKTFSFLCSAISLQYYRMVLFVNCSAKDFLYLLIVKMFTFYILQKICSLYTSIHLLSLILLPSWIWCLELANLFPISLTISVNFHSYISPNCILIHKSDQLQLTYSVFSCVNLLFNWSTKFLLTIVFFSIISRDSIWFFSRSEFLSLLSSWFYCINHLGEDIF